MRCTCRIDLVTAAGDVGADSDKVRDQGARVTGRPKRSGAQIAPKARTASHTLSHAVADASTPDSGNSPPPGLATFRQGRWISRASRGPRPRSGRPRTSGEARSRGTRRRAQAAGRRERPAGSVKSATTSASLLKFEVLKCCSASRGLTRSERFAALSRSNRVAGMPAMVILVPERSEAVVFRRITIWKGRGKCE